MSNKPKRLKLRNPRWTRVDLVPQGANYDLDSGEGSHVVLFKAAPPAEPVSTVPLVTSTPGRLPEVGVVNPAKLTMLGDGTPATVVPATSWTTTSPVVNITSGSSTNWEQIRRNFIEDLMTHQQTWKPQAKTDDSARPPGDATITREASAESAPSPGDKPVGDTPNAPADAETPATDPTPEPTTVAELEGDDVAKAVADLRSQLAVEKARADQVEKALREMREVEAERVFTEHAKQYDTVAPVEDLLPVLKAAAASGPEALGKLDEILKAAAARITTVDKWGAQAGSNVSLFGEVGTAKAANPNGALGELDALAAELQKAEPTLSVEQARSRVLKTRKDLYGQYIADHPGAGRAAR